MNWIDFIVGFNTGIGLAYIVHWIIDLWFDR